MNTPNRSKKIYIFSASLLLITFILGAFTGAGIMVTFSHGPMKGPPPMPPRGPAFHPLPLNELDLSEDQKKQVFSIMDKNRPKLDAIFEETFPKLQTEMKRVETEIRKLLNDDQKKRFDALIEKREKHMPDDAPPMLSGKRPPMPGAGPPPGAPL